VKNYQGQKIVIRRFPWGRNCLFFLLCAALVFYGLELVNSKFEKIIKTRTAYSEQIGRERLKHSDLIKRIELAKSIGTTESQKSNHLNPGGAAQPLKK
jgi:hypothetical protein